MRLLFVAALLAIMAAGQAPLPIRSDVRQVLVPVVVSDRKGHSMGGLKVSDFEVYEDDVRQRIVAVNTTEDQILDDAGGTSGSGRTGPSPSQTVHVNPVTPKRTYLICLDVLHSSFASVARARAALQRFFEQENSHDSQYALLALGREAHVVQDSTRDAGAVLAALQRKDVLKNLLDSKASHMARDAQDFQAVVGEYCRVCPCGGRSPEFPGCSGARARVQGVLLSSAERTSLLDQDFLRGLAGLVKATASMPTQRTMVLLSDGFNRFPGRELYGILQVASPSDRTLLANPRDSQELLQRVLRVAVQYDVRFYTVDTRGLYAHASLGQSGFDASNRPTSEAGDQMVMSVAHENTDALAELAQQTGGLFFEDNNDLARGIRQAFSDGRESYVLAYAPVNVNADGTFRKIRVEVKRKKVTVHAKAGYWAVRN